MFKISEQPLNPNTLTHIQNCAMEGLQLLDLPVEGIEPKAVVEAVDSFVYCWQKRIRPQATKLDPQDVPYLLGSLWGEQLIARFGWAWAMLMFHDHNDSAAPGVLTHDRSFVIYPIHFIQGCLQDPTVDATIALSFNMLEAGTISKQKPKGYLNLMDGVNRIVPRL